MVTLLTSSLERTDPGRRELEWTNYPEVEFGEQERLARNKLSHSRDKWLNVHQISAASETVYKMRKHMLPAAFILLFKCVLQRLTSVWLGKSWTSRAQMYVSMSASWNAEFKHLKNAECTRRHPMTSILSTARVPQDSLGFHSRTWTVPPTLNQETCSMEVQVRSDSHHWPVTCSSSNFQFKTIGLRNIGRMAKWL